MSNQATVDAVISAIAQRNYSGDLLTKIKALVESEKSDQIVQGFLDYKKSLGKDEAEAVSEAMYELEILAENAPLCALVLMAYLWPHTLTFCMHDVQDGIGLWMYHTMSPELKQHLRHMVSREQNAKVRKEYEEWLEYKITA